MESNFSRVELNNGNLGWEAWLMGSLEEVIEEKGGGRELVMAMTSGVRLDKLMELAITWMDRDKFNRSINFFLFPLLVLMFIKLDLLFTSWIETNSAWFDYKNKVKSLFISFISRANIKRSSFENLT